MKKLVLTLLIIPAVFISCKKKDTYGYTCRCKDKGTGQADTIYTITIQTSGEASFYCRNYADTANAHGKNIECNID